MIAAPAKIEIPQKVYLRRKEVERIVGGRRQLEALLRAGQLRGVRLPGYALMHYPRASVCAVMDTLFHHDS
jgi:hypothetical protein